MKVATIIGTRPQLIKAAALQPVLREQHQETLIDTGQHWDDNLAGTFFRELGLKRPDHTLGVGSGTHAQQVAAILSSLEPVLLDLRPDAVLVYGDTNSTLGGALAAAKLDIRVAHVEAGLRSFDRRMPEEVNRVVVDHLSSWLFAPTPTAMANLANEGISKGALLVGDLMQDLAARKLPEIRDEGVLAEIARDTDLGDRKIPLIGGRFLYATVHRQENREPDAVRHWSELLNRAATRDRPVVLALHPGTRAALERERIEMSEFVALVDPLGYRSSLALQLHCAAVLTDSGGIQREAAWLGTPCLILRGSTEWIEAVANADGQMVLVGRDVDLALELLAKLAPLGAEGSARSRAAIASIPKVGAADSITRALAV